MVENVRFVKLTLYRRKLGVTETNIVQNIFARFVFPNCGFEIILSVFQIGPNLFAGVRSIWPLGWFLIYTVLGCQCFRVVIASLVDPIVLDRISCVESSD